ncbi:hypothetical protein OT109_02745 [Phycisphaeraceae bacterium D3-23]
MSMIIRVMAGESETMRNGSLGLFGCGGVFLLLQLRHMPRQSSASSNTRATAGADRPWHVVLPAL